MTSLSTGHWLEPATLIFYEVLDGGNPSLKGEKEVPGGMRDAVYALKGPYQTTNPPAFSLIYQGPPNH